jgi:hypothetical protein
MAVGDAAGWRGALAVLGANVGLILVTGTATLAVLRLRQGSPAAGPPPGLDDPVAVVHLIRCERRRMLARRTRRRSRSCPGPQRGRHAMTETGMPRRSDTTAAVPGPRQPEATDGSPPPDRSTTSTGSRSPPAGRTGWSSPGARDRRRAAARQRRRPPGGRGRRRGQRDRQPGVHLGRTGVVADRDCPRRDHHLRRHRARGRAQGPAPLTARAPSWHGQRRMVGGVGSGISPAACALGAGAACHSSQTMPARAPG